MDCERCGDGIESGEEREHFGRVLCEDCYMDALSPVKACDPWAVHTAKSLAKDAAEVELSPNQKRILALLEETGGIEPQCLVERLNVKPTDLERDIAVLRHMEKLRAELRNGKNF